MKASSLTITVSISIQDNYYVATDILYVVLDQVFVFYHAQESGDVTCSITCSFFGVLGNKKQSGFGLVCQLYHESVI